VTAAAPATKGPPEPGQPEDQTLQPPDGAETADGDSTAGESAPPEAPKADTSPPDDMLRPSGRKAVVVESVRARVSAIGQTHIGSVVINEAGQHYRVPLTDLTALHQDTPFAPPPGYGDLPPALASGRVVVCLGPDGCGKEAAITRALREVGAERVRLLPTGLTVGEISRVVEAGAEDADAFVLPGLDEAALRALAGPAGQPIRAAVAAAHFKVAVITAAEPSATAQRVFEIAHLSYPDPSAVLNAYADHGNVPGEARDLAEQVLEQLSAPLPPATIAAVIREATAIPAKTAQEIAGMFTATLSDDAVRQWLGEGRPPEEVAILAAGATLSGAPSLVVQEQAHELANLLHPADAREQPKPVLGGTPWSSGLLRTATEKVNTHFGVRELQTAVVADPHRPADVLQAMWRCLGSDFQSSYCDWISQLPAAPQLRWHAAYSAGVLFANDPVLIEERVLRPWARSDHPGLRSCAGLALGAPLATGADADPSRALAHAWATSGSAKLREAAIAAYGGLLGAWDPGSAASLKLFRIGQATPSLAPQAAMAMARLMVAGAEATTSRAGVLAYLKIAATDRSTRDTAFQCLPLITEALTWPRQVCAESLSALRAETGNWDTFTELLATALINPSGISPGQQALAIMVRAVARGNIDHDIAEDVIRRMKRSQLGLGTLPRLGATTRRALSALSRSSDDEIKDVSTALIRQFYG